MGLKHDIMKLVALVCLTGVAALMVFLFSGVHADVAMFIWVGQIALVLIFDALLSVAEVGMRAREARGEALAELGRQKVRIGVRMGVVLVLGLAMILGAMRVLFASEPGPMVSSNSPAASAR